MNESSLEQMLDLCLRAGNIMLQSGAETSRVEETITRIGWAFGAQTVHTFATPTGIFLTLDWEGTVKTRIIRISGVSTINLNKVHEINDLSRRYVQHSITLDELSKSLDRINREPYYYRLRYQHLSAAISSGAFALLFGGAWPEFLVGSLSGWLSNTVVGLIGEKVPGFLRVFFAALVGVMVAVLGVTIGWANEIEASIIGAVIPLVPGVSVTNSVRDLMAGELLAGVARAADAALTAFAIAVAVALVLAFRMEGVAFR
jgi:uncharacterized membrane protein YjjP (DUF1212 family)